MQTLTLPLQTLLLPVIHQIHNKTCDLRGLTAFVLTVLTALRPQIYVYICILYIYIYMYVCMYVCVCVCV